MPRSCSPIDLTHGSSSSPIGAKPSRTKARLVPKSISSRKEQRGNMEELRPKDQTFISENQIVFQKRDHHVPQKEPDEFTDTDTEAANIGRSLDIAEDGDVVIVAGHEIGNTVKCRIDSSTLRKYKNWATFLDAQQAAFEFNDEEEIERQITQSSEINPEPNVSKSPLATRSLLFGWTLPLPRLSFWNSPHDEDRSATSLDVEKYEPPNNNDASNGPQLPHIPITDANPEAVAIALAVMHSQFHLLPLVVDFNTIYGLAVHCENFDTASLLEIFVARWTERFLRHAQESSSWTWLYIAWIFKFKPLFESQLHHMVCTSKRLGSGAEFEEMYSRKCGPHLIRLVVDSRERLLQNLLDLVAQYADEEFWHKNFECRHPDLESNCAEHGYVSFIVQLRAITVWPTPPSPSQIQGSAANLRERLHGIRFRPYSPDHLYCSALMEGFLFDVITLGYDMEHERFQEHFLNSQASLIGSYMFNYGFKAEDLEFTSPLKGPRPSHITSPFTMGDEISDEEDSDYDSSSESDTTSEEDFTEDSQETLQEISADKDEPPRKRARYQSPRGSSV